MIRRLLWSWTSSVTWDFTESSFRVKVKAPQSVDMNQYKYWVNYDESSREFVLNGVKPWNRNIIAIVDIENALPVKKISQA
jgi:hypothetical protein